MTRPKKIVTKRTFGRKVINFFILTFAALVTLLIFFFGFSQTSTFRNYLKETIISQVNGSINGKLNIESLNGSVLTSVILKNTSLVQETDTLFKAENISLKLKPHKLIFDVIYVRQLQLFDAEIDINQDKNLVWNIDKLSLPDTSAQTEPIDTTQEPSPLPYTIQIDDLELSKINFTYKSYENSDTSKKYDIINWDDMEFKNVNFSASVIADLKNSRFNLQLKHLSFLPNARKFNLNHLGGNFFITPEFAEVENLAVYTDSTEIVLSARLDRLNLLGSVVLEDFKDYPLNLRLRAPKVHFDDLTYFIGATDILKGTPSLEIDAKGKFGDFDISYMKMSFLKTSLNLTGKVEHLNTPGKLFITAEVKNSTVNQPDADKLLPTIGIPVMNNLIMTNFNAKFKGEPINFNSTIAGNIHSGQIKANAKLDMTKPQMLYDIKFQTKNLNLEPVINIKTSLTSNGTCSGRGTDPRKMNSRILVNAFNSEFLNYSADSLTLDLTARNKEISVDLDAILEGSKFTSQSILDFSDPSTTGFDFAGSFSDLNLANVLDDSTHQSSMNLRFDLSGKDLDLSKTVAELNFEIDNSKYQNRKIDYSEIDLLVNFDDHRNRNIKLLSDVLDFNINGKFDLQELIKLTSYESEVISTVMLSKLTRLNPLFVIQDSTIINSDNLKYDNITKSYQKADFNFNFKNSNLTNFILGGNNISLAASGEGFLENDSTGFSFSSELNLDHFTRINEGNPIYLSDLYLNLHLSRNNNLIAFKELFGNLSVEGKRIYAGSEIGNIESEISFNANKMYFSLSSEIDSIINVASEGLINMSDSIQAINISNLDINYNNSDWKSQDTVKLTYKPLSFILEDLNLQSGSANLKAEGTLYNFGEQQFQFILTDMQNDNLGKFLSFLDDPLFNTYINSTVNVSGSFTEPIIEAKITADSLRYGSKLFGSVEGKFSYQDQLLNSTIAVHDSIESNSEKVLNVAGFIPVNLSFGPVEERLISDRPINMTMSSTAFNLNTFGNVLPFIKNPSGLFLADLKAGGTFDHIEYSGYAEVKNSRMTIKLNNLEYNLDFKLNFNDQQAVFENLIISNTSDAKNIGTLTGTGEVNFKGIAPDNFNLLLNGDLSLLAQKSKLANTNYFGDLFIETKTPLSFKYENSGSKLNGELLLKKTDILYSLEDERTEKKSSDFIYKYKVDSSKIDKEELRFKALLSEVNTVSNQMDYQVKNFDFNLSFEIESSARLVIVLPNLANQKLFIEAAGGFTYTSINDVPRAQGTINLLPGSTLDFFKKFDASGSLRFESELSNPYLDISAIYQNDYVAPNATQAEPVAVRIKIQGPLENLGRSLSSNENIAIQRGQSNIQNDVKDARYDFSDALTFLAFNTFKEDFTNQSQQAYSQFATSAGMSIAGTFLSDLVNSSVGGVINNIQLSQSQYANKENYLYNLSGKYKDFRYSFGGSFGGNSRNLQFKNMELKIEYLFSPNFSIRGEQRRPIGASYNLEEMIQELGFKYNIEF